jgi:DNA gyrase subunit B
MYHLKNALKKIMKANEEEFRTQYDKLVNFKLKKGDLNKKQKINTLLGQDIQSDSVRNARRAASYLPSKLLDAYSSNRQDCELFIVEGNSAMSDFQKYRDAKVHAVIPLRGVPLNACHHDIDKVLEVSQEFRDMMKGIGSGVDENYNLKKLRYGKIIVSADADADGNRICAMILGFFGAHCKYLIDNGNVYVAVTPFYIQEGNLFYNGEHNKLNTRKPFKRIKGLGSLGKDFPNALLNQKTRRLIKVTSENVNEAIAVLTNAGRRKELLLESGALKEEVYK